MTDKTTDWEMFFKKIIDLHPLPTIVMLKIDEDNQVSLIAAASSVETLVATLEKTKPDYMG